MVEPDNARLKPFELPPQPRNTLPQTDGGNLFVIALFGKPGDFGLQKQNLRKND